MQYKHRSQLNKKKTSFKIHICFPHSLMVAQCMILELMSLRQDVALSLRPD